jgi:Zn-dependent protease/CBS domain-containing protein
MKRSATIPLGHVLGIPVDLDYSWFLIFALVTWTLAVGYYPAEFQGPAVLYWIMGAVTAVLLFASVLLHELGHSVVAMQYRIPVRRITLFIFGGVAQIGAEPPSPSAEFLIAVAGPLVSLVLAVFFALLSAPAASVPPLWAFVTYLAYINGALVLFNLIPGFPLDGGRVFRAIAWAITRNFRRATTIAATLGRIIGFLFVLLGIWQVFVGNFINGLWIAFIGWFLESAASAQIGQLQYGAIDEVLAGHRVSDAMNGHYTEVPADMTLQELVDHNVLAAGQRSFVVKNEGRVAGLLTLHRVKEVSRLQWPMTTAGQAMIPAADMKRIGPDTQLREAVREMDRGGVNQLPVMVDGKIVGMLTREGVISFLRTIQELQR